MQPVEQKLMRPEIIKKIEDTKVIAVLVIEKREHAVPLAEALTAGGVNAIELTLRTDAALDAAKDIRQKYPDVLLGIGTVLTTRQVKRVADLGVDFAVAPGCNPVVIESALKEGLSFAPGVMTPSDIEKAVELGCRVLKYFPAESSGGLKHLKSISSPYQYLGLKFMPLGGLTLNNVGPYLESPLVTAIGGSWIAKPDMILNEQWDVITKNAHDIRELI